MRSKVRDSTSEKSASGKEVEVGKEHKGQLPLMSACGVWACGCAW